ncbi:MAG TPA: twin-arginine translocase TatA/TatE family subunit [Spirochaetota bacterium]
MNLGFGELIVVFLIILVVFGAGRIPKIARDLGLGIREFKSAMSGNDDETPAKKELPKKQSPRAKKASRTS